MVVRRDHSIYVSSYLVMVSYNHNGIFRTSKNNPLTDKAEN